MGAKDLFKFIVCIFLAGTAWIFLPAQIQYIGVEFSVGYRILIGGIALGIFSFLKSKFFLPLIKNN